MISLHNMLPFELTKDTPYLALSGELWSVFYEYFNRNWSCYKGFLLYITLFCVNIITYPYPELDPGPQSTKRTDVLPQDHVKSRSREIWV